MEPSPQHLPHSRKCQVHLARQSHSPPQSSHCVDSHHGTSGPPAPGLSPQRSHSVGAFYVALFQLNNALRIHRVFVYISNLVLFISG
jgi:hypothetical protein